MTGRSPESPQAGRIDEDRAPSEVSGTRRVEVRGVVRVPLVPKEAFGLFTPSGERVWAAGWSPRFPVAVDDETTPGTVFETFHDGHRTTWVVAACEPGSSITYARIGDDDRAGIVTVDCRPDAGGSTEALVGYTLTALSDEAQADLAGFAAGFDEFLDHWEYAIARHLRGAATGAPTQHQR